MDAIHTLPTQKPLNKIMAYIITQCWALIFILPFAIYVRYSPIPQWVSNASVVWLTLILWCCLLFLRQLPRRVPIASLWLLSLAIIWLIQPVFTDIVFPGLNVGTALMLSSMALLAYVCVGLQQTWTQEKLIEWLAWALLCGAIIQSVIGLYQVTGWIKYLHGLLFYSSSHTTSNIIGHIGQRNQYAHYLSWGILALGYLAAERHLKWFFAVPLTVLFALLIGWSGSRIGLTYFVAIIIIASLWHWRLRDARSLRLWACLCAISIAVLLIQWLVLPWANDWLQLQASSSGFERVTENAGSVTSQLGRRIVEWHKAWRTFQAYPIFGCGWLQFGAQSLLLHLRPEFINAAFSSSLFTHSHNLVLQLLAETGLVGTLAVVGGFIWLIKDYFLRPAVHASVLPLGMMSISLLHSMFEYPLWRLCFLGIFVIALSFAPTIKPNEIVKATADNPSRKKWLVPSLSAIFVTIFSFFSITGWYQYWEMVSLHSPSYRVEFDKQRAARLESIIDEQPLYAFYALESLDNYIIVDRFNVSYKLYYVHLLAKTHPYSSVIFKKARLEALSDNKAAARESMRLALASFPTHAKSYLGRLPTNEPAYDELRAMAQQRYDTLPPAYK